VDRLHAVSPTAQPATSRVTNNLAQLVKDSNVQQQQQRGSMDGVQVCNVVMGKSQSRLACI